MNYDKYIFDWENNLLEDDEYGDTSKYAFSLLNKAISMLKKFKNERNPYEDDNKELEKIINILQATYLETSHNELYFDEDYFR